MLHSDNNSASNSSSARSASWCAEVSEGQLRRLQISGEDGKQTRTARSELNIDNNECGEIFYTPRMARNELIVNSPGRNLATFSLNYPKIQLNLPSTLHQNKQLPLFNFSWMRLHLKVICWRWTTEMRHRAFYSLGIHSRNLLEEAEMMMGKCKIFLRKRRRQLMLPKNFWDWPRHIWIMEQMARLIQTVQLNQDDFRHCENIKRIPKIIKYNFVIF